MRASSIHGTIMFAAKVGFLILGAVIARQLIVGLPAFNENHRVSGLYGDWRVDHGPAFYDPSDYSIQVAYQFLSADAVASDVTGDIDTLSSLETVVERASQATSLLENALENAPGNGHAWYLLSLSRAQLGDFEKSTIALKNSAALAPANSDLALERLILLDLIAEWNNLLVPEKDLFCQDFQTVSGGAYFRRAKPLDVIGPIAQDLTKTCLSMDQSGASNFPNTANVTFAQANIYGVIEEWAILTPAGKMLSHQFTAQSRYRCQSPPFFVDETFSTMVTPPLRSPIGVGFFVYLKACSTHLQQFWA